MTLTDINFKCTACEQRLVADVSGAGTVIACPVCALDITIPHENTREPSNGRRNHVRADVLLEPANGAAELNSVRADHDRAAAALAQTETELKRLVAEQASWHESRRRLEAARTQAEQKLHEAEQQRATASAELQQAQQQRDAVLAELSAAQQRIAGLEADTAARNSEALAQLQAERAALEQKLHEALAAQQTEIAAPTEDVLARVQAERAELEQKVQELLAERDEMQASLGRKQQRLGEMEARLLERDAAARQQIAQSEAAWNDVRAQLEAERGELERKLVEALQEREAFSESLARNRQRVAALEGRFLEHQAVAKQELAALQAEWDEERARLEAEVAHAQQKLDDAGQQAQAVAECLELNHKRVAALEAQLAERERSWQERGLSIESLRAELSHSEARMVELETELAAARAEAGVIPALQAKIETLETRLSSVEAERDSLQHLRDEATLEINSLKKGLGDSKRGRELLDLRNKVKATERERAAAERRCQEAEKEAARAKAGEARWREDCEQLLRRYQEAESRVPEEHDGNWEDSRAVLRGIIDRQAAEIAFRARELSRLRRAQFGMRLAYALVAVGALAFGAVLIRVVQSAL